MLVSNFYRQHFSGNHKTFIAGDHKYMAKGNRLSDWPENKARNNQQHNKKKTWQICTVNEGRWCWFDDDDGQHFVVEIVQYTYMERIKINYFLINYASRCATKKGRKRNIQKQKKIRYLYQELKDYALHNKLLYFYFIFLLWLLEVRVHLGQPLIIHIYIILVILISGMEKCKWTANR